jgi:hypothetical protein
MKTRRKRLRRVPRCSAARIIAQTHRRDFGKKLFEECERLSAKVVSWSRLDETANSTSLFLCKGRGHWGATSSLPAPSEDSKLAPQRRL